MRCMLGLCSAIVAYVVTTMLRAPVRLKRSLYQGIVVIKAVSVFDSLTKPQMVNFPPFFRWVVRLPFFSAVEPKSELAWSGTPLAAPSAPDAILVPIPESFPAR